MDDWPSDEECQQMENRFTALIEAEFIDADPAVLASVLVSLTVKFFTGATKGDKEQAKALYADTLNHFFAQIPDAKVN